jgi:hypothetical protein
MNELEEQLRRLAATLPRGTSEEVEQRLLAAFRARRYAKKRWWIYLAAAAFLAGVVGLYLAKPRTAAVSKYQAGAFVMLPYAQSDVPLEQPVVVRVSISVSALSVMGVPSLAGANERVNAELLVGQDGVARAVRFVQ